MTKKQISKNSVFKNFSEYWYYARHLSIRQRNIIFNSLSSGQQDIITKSYSSGNWDDVFYKNVINEKADILKERYGYDLFDIRYKVLLGKSVYLPREFWEIVDREIGKYESEYISFLLGGITALQCKENKEVVLLISSSSSHKI